MEPLISIGREWSNLLPLSLKILEHILGHLSPHLVHEVKLITWSFRSSPLVPPVGFKIHLHPVHHPLSSPGAPGVEPRHLGDLVGAVEHLNPLVDLLYLCPPVGVFGRIMLKL